MPRIPEDDFDGDPGGHRTMDHYEIPTADELVELDEMDVPGFSGLRRVENDEQVIGVGVDLRQMAPFEDIPNGQRVETEAVRQRGGCFLIA
jgi:hypothetical protein